MRNILLLLNVLFKSGGNAFDTSKNNKSHNKNKGIGNAALYVILFICFLPLTFVAYNCTNTLYEVFKPLNQEGYVMQLALTTVSVTIFVFSMFSIASVLFFSKDIEYFLPLPLKSREITMAKFLYILIGEYFIEAIFIIPTYVMWIINEAPGVLFYINAIIVFLVTPVIPILISSFIIMPVMRFSGFSKHKDMFTIIASLCGIGFAIGINIFVNSSVSQKFDVNSITNMMNSKNGFMDVTSSIFVNVNISAKCLTDYNIGTCLVNMLLLLVIIACAIFIFSILSDALYLKGTMNSIGSFSKKKKITDKEFEKSTSGRKPIIALTLNEAKSIIRTPIYLMNCAGSLIFSPIFMAIIYFQISSDIEIDKIISLLNDNEFYRIVALVIIYGITVLLATISPPSGTSISREGSNLFISRYIPVDYFEQIKAKLIPSIVIDCLASYIIVLFTVIILKRDIIFIISSIIVATLIASYSSMVAILIDIMRPKLTWNTEEQAVKQNLNPFIAYIICLATLAPGAILTIVLGLNGTSIYICELVMIATLVALNFIIYIILKGYGLKRFIDLEA